MNDLDPKWIRVSSILELLPTKDFTGNWFFPLQMINKEVLERKKNIGTSVHEAIASHNKKGFYVLAEEEEGYFKSYLQWEKSVEISEKYIEQRMFYEPMKLTGCADMILKEKGKDELTLVDFKCTVAEDPVKWPLQGAFYEFLARMHERVVYKEVLFIRLDKTGGFPKIYRYEITKELTATAMSLYNVYVYLTNK